MRLAHVMAAAAAFAPVVANAAEIITYNYDAKGRLTQVVHSGSTNNGVVSAYAYDNVDNRTVMTVSGSPFNAPIQPVIVLPLGGMPLLALPLIG